jgi:hypothetical protein
MSLEGGSALLESVLDATESLAVMKGINNTDPKLYTVPDILAPSKWV